MKASSSGRERPDPCHALDCIVLEDLKESCFAGARKGQRPLVDHEAVTDQQQGNLFFPDKEFIDQVMELPDRLQDHGMVLGIDGGVLDGRRELGHHLADRFLQRLGIHRLFLASPQYLRAARPDIAVPGTPAHLQQPPDLGFGEKMEIPVECRLRP